MTGNFSEFLNGQGAATQMVHSVENEVLLIVYSGNQFDSNLTIFPSIFP